MTGHTVKDLNEDWDLPLLNAWNKLMGGMMPLPVMVGRYLGYKSPEISTKRMTLEESSARLMKGMGMM